jgi:adenosylcobinamide-phosphate synthase
MPHRLLIILLALALDLAFGDPPNRLHPVVLMGRWLGWGRHLAPTTGRFWFGAGWTLAGLALFSLPWPSQRQPKWSAGPTRLISLLLAALGLKAIFAYRSLRRVVREVGQALARNEIDEARRLTGWHLVSRDTGQLSEAEVAGAAIESLAENLTDSVTAPLLAFQLGGLGAAWGYRFINTADAMWGYRTPEFEQLGKFPARLDDLLNWLPARLTGWLLIAAAWLAGADGRGAQQTMLAQHDQVTSPNAGWTMSAMAGALGVVLSKRGVYALRGGPAEPGLTTIHQAVRIADITIGLSLALLAGLGLLGRIWAGYERGESA